ncbi:MAG TPA: S9 family peptidase [Cyclobacteriaceae bacterium]
MNRLILLLPLIFFFGACNTQRKEPEKPKKYTIAQFMDIVQMTGGAFSPDESRVLVNTKESGIFNAYEIDLATGEKKQLTHSDANAIFGQSYFPADDRIVYTSDKGGDEISHIYVRDPDGTSRDLIADSTAKANFYGWSYDKKFLYYGSNTRDKRFFDTYKIRVDALGEGTVFSSTIVYRNTEGLDAAAISRDERYIALVKFLATNNNEMYLLDTRTGKITHLSPHEGDISYQPQYFSLDGTRMYFLTNEGSEFMYLDSYDIATGKREKVQEEPWDIMYTYESRNGKYRIVAVNNDARTETKIYDESAGGKLVNIPNLPAGDITGVNISDSEKLMVFYVSSSQSPANLFLYNFDTKEVKQLSNNMTKEIDPKDLVAGEVIRYASYDGLQIPSLLYKPKGLRDGEKVPALVYVHGGPGGQTRLNYSAMIQHLVNHGYAILAVNNRGSSGYGKTFFAADDRKHGDVDLKDCIASKKYLATLPYIDTTKIGIFGGSYGGYMVMAALAFAPEEFDVGVNLFGVTNWLRTLKSTPPWWASYRDALFAEMGNPFTEDSVSLYDKSPLFHARNITKPFIVLQGSNDPRVLQVESDEIVKAARDNNVPVEYIIFPDEGHGFLKKENNIKSSQEILKFLDKYLKGLPDDQAGEQVARFNE